MSIRCLIGHRWIVIESQTSYVTLTMGGLMSAGWTATVAMECSRCKARKSITYHPKVPAELMSSDREARCWARGQGFSPVPDRLPPDIDQPAKRV